MTVGRSTAHRLELLIAAALFSTGGAAIKGCAMTAWQVASFRSLIAAATLLLLLPSARRGWSWRTVAVGAAYAATMVLYVTSNKLTTAANTIFLQSTAPVYIVMLGPWLLGERIRSRDLGFMATVACGMGLFFVGSQPASATAPNPELGNILAAASGVMWAFTIMGLRGLGRAGSLSTGPAAAVTCGNLLAGVATLPAALPVTDVPPENWLNITFLGVVQIGIAYVFFTRGMRGVPALEASLLLLVEPVLNPIWAWLAHGERPTGWAVIGGLIILTATAVNTAIASKRGAGGPGEDPGG